MDIILAAGAVGLAGYALGKRRERRQMANGYVTYSGNQTGAPQYANVHYGKTGNQGGRHRQHQIQQHQTGYYNTTVGR